MGENPCGAASQTQGLAPRQPHSHDVCKKKVGGGRLSVLARGLFEEMGVLSVLVTPINKVLPGQGGQTCPRCPAV